MSREIALSWRGVTKRYGAVRALDGLDLEVERGEVFGFLGPNGAGKSTAIKIAVGLVLPDRGEAAFSGIPASRPESRAGVGYLPEETGFPARFRLGEWVRHQLALRSCDDARVAAAAERVGLEGRMDGALSGFSKGMKRRAAFLFLIAFDPEIWLLDEPTADLDVPGREMVENVILEARERDRTFFISSHILSEVERVCDRVGIIGKGRLEKTAKPAELLPAPFLVDLTLPVLFGDPGALLAGRPYVLNAESRRLRVFVADRSEGDEVIRAIEAGSGDPAQTLFRPASLRDAMGEVRR